MSDFDNDHAVYRELRTRVHQLNEQHLEDTRTLVSAGVENADLRAQVQQLAEERNGLLGRIEAAIQRNEQQEDAPWLADVLWPPAARTPGGTHE